MYFGGQSESDREKIDGKAMRKIEFPRIPCGNCIWIFVSYILYTPALRYRIGKFDELDSLCMFLMSVNLQTKLSRTETALIV